MAKNIAVAYGMQKRQKKYAKGGQVNKLHQGAHEARVYSEQKQEKGVNTPRMPYPHSKGSFGESSGGYSAKDKTPELNEQAKKQHKATLQEMKDMPKPKIQGLAEGGMVNSIKGRTYPLKHPKIATSGVFQAKLLDQEDHLEDSAKPNQGPQHQPPKAYDEEMPDRQGPSTPALKMKKMAEGGMINRAVSMKHAEEDMVEHPAHLEEDDDQMRPEGYMDEQDPAMYAKGGEVDLDATASDPQSRPDKGFGAIIVKKMMAQGGDVSEQDIEQAASIAASIMAKRRRMAEGGSIGDTESMFHFPRKASDKSQVDIESNGEEHPNAYYGRNEEILKENYDEDMEDVTQPMDSNEHGDEIDGDDHDMVSAIRRKMKSKSPITR